MGIGDYIPARGEARVLAELKGSYGGKRMARNRYQRRGGGRRPWVRTWWQVAKNGESQEWSTLLATPQLTASFQPADIATAEGEDLVGRLLRFQGGLYVRLNPGSGVAPTTVDASLGAYVFYAWMLQKLSGNSTLDVPADTDLSPAADWPQMMRRKDIIRWGVVRVMPTERYEFFQGLISTQDGGAIPYPSMDQGSPRPYTRIPWPRLPRQGLKLDSSSNVLCCYTTVLANDWSAQYANSANGWVAQQFHLYRTLWAKA